MKAVVQRVKDARVSVEGRVVGAIDTGLLVYLGVGKDDTEADAAWLERAFSFAYSALSDERRAAGDHLGAWRLAVAATERFPSYPRLAMLERLARANWARAAYNEFVALYNAKRYAEALETVRAALALAPKEALLLEAESLVLKSLR